MAERRTIPVYLSLEEAAEAMSVSVKTIRRWIGAGTLPAYRCGKRSIGSSSRTWRPPRARFPPREYEARHAIGTQSSPMADRLTETSGDAEERAALFRSPLAGDGRLRGASQAGRSQSAWRTGHIG